MGSSRNRDARRREREAEFERERQEAREEEDRLKGLPFCLLVEEATDNPAMRELLQRIADKIGLED
jgi:hypothetical protein